MDTTTAAPPVRGRYRDDPGALRALVRDDAVHRDAFFTPPVGSAP